MAEPRLWRGCRFALWLIACAVTLSVFFLNTVYSAQVLYDSYEIVEHSTPIVQNLLLLAGIFVLLVISGLHKDRLAKVKESRLFAVLCVVYALAAAYVICNSCNELRADAGAVYLSAGYFRAGDDWIFSTGNYMSYYPQQLGLMTYDLLLTSLWDDPRIFFIANTLFILGINFLTWRISNLLFQNRKVNLPVIALSFAFLPQFFFLMFAYGLIPGFFFLTLAFYFTLRFAKEGKLWQLFALVGCIALAVLLKQNNLIGGIAIFLYLLLKLLKKEGNWKYLIVLPLLLISLVLPSNLLRLYYESATGCKLDQGVPSILWVAMGTDLNNTARNAPGGYDGSTLDIYFEAGCDPEAASEAGMKKLRNNLSKIKQNPKEAFDFFGNKIIYQWCDPLYQSIWSGPYENEQQGTYTDVLKSIYNGGGIEKLIRFFSKGVTLFIWAFAAIALIFNRKKLHDGWMLLTLLPIGGFFFHIFWEGKSQYIHPYVFTLIPLAAYGFCLSCKKLQSFLGRSQYEG